MTRHRGLPRLALRSEVILVELGFDLKLSELLESLSEISKTLLELLLLIFKDNSPATNLEDFCLHLDFVCFALGHFFCNQLIGTQDRGKHILTIEHLVLLYWPYAFRYYGGKVK